MPQQIAEALPFLPLTLGPLLLLLLAPLFGSNARRVIAIVLICGALTLLFFAIAQMDRVAQLQVLNRFPIGPDAKPETVRIEVVEAPAWRWPAFAALMLAFPALLLLARREPRQHPPHPVTYGALLGFWFFLARLGFEKTAAPADLVFATGLTNSIPLIVLFAGIYAGRRGWSFGRFCAGLVGLAYLQRLPLIAWSYYATTQHAGTHLDLSPILDLNVPLIGGPGPGASPTQKWIYGTLIPHTTLWILVTVVLGIALGGIAWAATRRRER